ncbi:hypothetical protein A0H81_11151 [Grifola frondosa]|uniref:Uncharacterized protein n=1 Tax=Grifola frondosa TaxID=5627 RepID=A0A1C7LW95_GRIFR|nr:hypothetical protein A0H81_11151 [Grifola frondosa]
MPLPKTCSCGVKIRWRISVLFRENRHLLRYGETIRALRKAQRWRDIFVRAKEGDEHLQTVLQRYDKMIEAKRDKEKFKMMLIEAIEWREKMKRRAILTGAYHRPTLYNRPLPRMKPQPVHVTATIRRLERMAGRPTAGADVREKPHTQSRQDGVQVDPVFSDAPKEWEEFINKQMYDIRQTFERDAARATTPYSPEMLEMIKAARREKIANKTRERERERRGQVFRKTLKRQRQGPPAHVLAIMTERQKHMDKVSRGVSEVGYVGQVKRALGFKLRNPDAGRQRLEVGG